MEKPLERFAIQFVEPTTCSGGFIPRRALPDEPAVTRKQQFEKGLTRERGYCI
jgi:hypothetical protein